MVPEQATTGTPQVTTNANTGYGFYDEYGRIVNPDTAHEIANATIAKEEELLQQHKEMANETEKLKGGYLEVIKPVVEKYSDLFSIEYDADGEPVVISNPIEGTVPGLAKDTRVIVCSKEGFARIVSPEPLANNTRKDLQSLSPETLKQWKQALSDNRISSKVYNFRSDLKLKLGGSEYYGISFQKIEGPSISTFVKKPLEILIQERNTNTKENLNTDVIASLKKEFSDL